MSRKKVILSIFLMIALVLVGIVLPAIWKMEKQDSEKSAESTHTTTTEKEPTTIPERVVSDLEYIGFDTLKEFFSGSQIADLKEQFPSYFKKTGQTDISSLEFLPDETSYPDKDSTLLLFALSDDTLLPVTYSTSSGAFFFGEEKLQVSADKRTYPRQTDDTLESLTTEDIETRQEGGFADTTDDVIEEPEMDSSQPSDTKEVQP
ncbi:DUF5038 domain-containing protein [Anaerostipes caccae]|uniref:DUF5038 domain-containing protein n=1 Tax=Anaerostipes caccae TaxID=105841 RepID=UPI002671E401|nr:DUF5038 domain-containing protein [Anaerostipes caccae]